MDGMDVTDTPLFQRAYGGWISATRSEYFRGLTVEKNILSVLEITEKKLDMRDAMAKS